jgi:hypothetical protein
MKVDFTIATYLKLLDAFEKQGYNFSSISKFIQTPLSRTIILRHDVDRLPQNSLKFARLQNRRGISATYYFRIGKRVFNEPIITEICNLGHEVGYHYEDLSNASRTTNGGKNEKRHAEIGIECFKKNLKSLRDIAPVSTICMHGSPLSKWDSRLLWKYYNYKEEGIIGEPYFDIDFGNIVYLTDTGRRWDGSSVSIRDKVSQKTKEAVALNEYSDWVCPPKAGSLMNISKEGIELHMRHHFRSTIGIIKAVKSGQFHDTAMMTFHPQRWSSNPALWAKELLLQSMKNAIKYFILKVK